MARAQNSSFIGNGLRVAEMHHQDPHVVRHCSVPNLFKCKKVMVTDARSSAVVLHEILIARYGRRSRHNLLTHSCWALRKFLVNAQHR